MHQGVAYDHGVRRQYPPCVDNSKKRVGLTRVKYPASARAPYVAGKAAPARRSLNGTARFRPAGSGEPGEIASAELLSQIRCA